MGKRGTWRRRASAWRPPSGERVSLHVLDQYRPGEIRWLRQRADALLAFHYRFYSELHLQRSQRADQIRDALLSASNGPVEMSGWFRVVSYNRSLLPLSWRGSLVEPGGRFNIPEMDAGKFAPFPALYLAEDPETALLERFGRSDKTGTPLTRLDDAVRGADSFSGVRCRWQAEKLIDLRLKTPLDPFVSIIAKFVVPRWLIDESRRLKIEPPELIRTGDKLMEALLHPDWRTMPMQMEVPAASQVFGQLVYDAGIEGIIYRSKHNGRLCVALFPFNFENSDSFVEVEDPGPEGAKIVGRLDHLNCRLMDFVRADNIDPRH